MEGTLLKLLILFEACSLLAAWVSWEPGCSSRRNELLRLSLSQVTELGSLASRIAPEDLRTLEEKDYVVIENFLPEALQEKLRRDVDTLRDADQFNIAKIGQDATNTLNTDIRVAETCFLGPTKLLELPSSARSQLYDVLDCVREDLQVKFDRALDSTLTELLYAYYPQGGFYRRHRDAIPGSASSLREYSLLLYLNKDWNNEKGGQLRMHMDSGGDFLPPGEDPSYEDVVPNGGTLVLFKSDSVPHEVLDTKAERVAVVGWYNRPVRVADIAELSGMNAMDSNRLILLALGAALTVAGGIMLSSAM